MAKILTAALTCSLLLGACSSIKPVEDLEAGSSTGAGDTPEALSLEEAPDLTQVISLDDALAAIEDLRVPRPLTTTWIGQDNIDGLTAAIHESNTSDPSSSVTHVTVDGSKAAEMYRGLLADFANSRSEQSSDVDEETTEDNSPTFAGIAAAMSIPLQYYIEHGPEGSTAWIQMSDQTAHERAQIEFFSLIYGDSEDWTAYEDLIIDLPQFREKWIAVPINHGDYFPSGFGTELSTDFGLSLFYSVGIRDGLADEGLQISERSRDSQRIIMELTQDNNDDLIVVEFDGEGRIIAVEEQQAERPRRIEFDWEPDLSLLQLPPVESRMSEVDMAELTAAYEEALVTALDE